MANRPWQNADVLKELYYGQNLSQPEMADKLDCSRWTIRKWMDRHDIDTRDKLEARMLWHRRDGDVPLDDMQSGYEYFRHHYDNEGNQVYHHRLLAVAKYGFDAVKGKQVHHKNHIPWDNRPENIELMDASEHKTHHLHIEHGNKPMPTE